MIVCPKCDTENADNANHCGNCGAQIQKGSGQKTMFGFAAVSAEDMKKAAEEAKAAAAGNKPAPTLPKPSIPSPGRSASQARWSTSFTGRTS